MDISLPKILKLLNNYKSNNNWQNSFQRTSIIIGEDKDNKDKEVGSVDSKVDLEGKGSMEDSKEALEDNKEDKDSMEDNKEALEDSKVDLEVNKGDRDSVEDNKVDRDSVEDNKEVKDIKEVKVEDLIPTRIMKFRSQVIT